MYTIYEYIYMNYFLSYNCQRISPCYYFDTVKSLFLPFVFFCLSRNKMHCICGPIFLLYS